MSKNNNFSFTKRLAETALMLAVGTVLSVFKLIELPYGGSVTVGSMVPILVIAYRYGTGYGLLTGFVYGLIQQLLGLKTLSYVTTWQSILAVILLDYAVAFMVIGLGGLFRKLSSQKFAMFFGAILCCVLRFVCHVISGATVWAGLSIPSKAALIYSIGYNATFMIPETILTVGLAYYIGAMLNFRDDNITAFATGTKKVFPVLKCIGGLLLTIALIIDVRVVFSKIQNADTGDFDITAHSDMNWTPLIILSAVALVLAIILFTVNYVIVNRQEATKE